MLNLKGRQDAVLDTFGGTVTVAQPHDLPEGASPRNQNMDFSIGSTFTRQGLESEYTFAGNFAGPNPGEVAVDTPVAVTSVPWNNPSFVLTDTANKATALITVGVQSVTVTKGGTYASGVVPSVIFSGSGAGGAAATVNMASNGVGGYYVASVTVNSIGSYSGAVTVSFSSGDATAQAVLSGGTDGLDITHFGFSIPSISTLQGLLVNVKAFSSSPVSLYATILKAGIPAGQATLVGTLTGSTINYTVGGINFLFGTSWLYSDINNLGFGVRINAFSSAPSVVSVGYVTISPYFVPLQENFNYIATFEDSFGNIKTLAEDALGDWWLEDVTNNPGVLSPLFTGPPAGSFASSFTANSRQYIAISDISQGNFPPQQYTGQWRDRVSQVGPGAPPSFQGTLQSGTPAPITAYSVTSNIVTLTAANTFTAGEVVTFSITSGPLFLNGASLSVLGTGLSGTQFEVAFNSTGAGAASGVATPQYQYPIVASPNGITQYPPYPVPGNAGPGGGFDEVTLSAGPGTLASGNVATFYYATSGPDNLLVSAFQSGKFPVYVYISGAPVGNGTQLVTSVGLGTPPHLDHERFYFTCNLTTTGQQSFGNPSPGTYQMTIATVNTVLPLPGVQTGDQVTISGDSVTSWDTSWNIVAALNSGSYSISATSMTAGTATYNWALSGSTSTPPIAGQLVTVTGTLNGNGIFNITDGVISSVTGTSSGTFTVSGFAGTINFSSQTEVGQATTSGTKFQIDPGVLTLGNAQSPIYGNSGGGFITLVGSTSIIIGPGTRRAIVFFITRNGFYTDPSPYTQFSTVANTNYILASNIPIGPPNVIGRGIAFTEAGANGVPGANYYTLPTAVQFVLNGVTYSSSSLFINDNTSTTAKFTFTDQVLLSGQEIDIQGQDLFNLGELGDAAWCAQYAGRSIWGRVRNKIQNFLNLSFDGGYNPNPGSNLLPLGWNLDPTYTTQAGVNLLQSPVFGNSFYIQNLTGSTQPIYGLITQSAYQDQNLVAILLANTAYSVRVTARTPSSATAGSLVIDLTSFNSTSGYGQTYGAFTLPLASINSAFAIYSGTLLTTEFTTVPSSLLLRLYAAGLLNGGDVEIDRIEIYPTIEPTNLTDLVLSYKNNLESFDQVTGTIDTTTVNAQPANGGFEMNGLFYIVKESSLGYISDTPNQEPQEWNPYKEVSNIAGACGINAYDVGKKWAVMGCQNGLFLFNGGEPIQIELEQPDIWQAINWSHAQGLVVRNDTTQNRFFVACPMVTPNPWCPDFPANDGTTGNNVIIYINYDAIGTIEELMSAASMHITMMGKLSVHDMRRKWSLWSIPCPYLAMVKRSELFSEMFFCNGIASSKIYSLDSYKTGADDGVPFLSSYCTYAFVDENKAKENPAFGQHNKRYAYYDLLISGSGDINEGTLSITFYQNSLQAPYPFSVPGGVTLADPAANDIEGPFDEYAQRMFVDIKCLGTQSSSIIVGSSVLFTPGLVGYFSISRATLVCAQDRWAPLRGF